MRISLQSVSPVHVSSIACDGKHPVRILRRTWEIRNSWSWGAQLRTQLHQPPISFSFNVSHHRCLFLCVRTCPQTALAIERLTLNGTWLQFLPQITHVSHLPRNKTHKAECWGWLASQEIFPKNMIWVRPHGPSGSTSETKGPLRETRDPTATTLSPLSFSPCYVKDTRKLS